MVDVSEFTLTSRIAHSSCVPSQTHESSVGAWKNFDLRETEMPKPPELKEDITWFRGQPDVELPLLSAGGRRINTPYACLGPYDEEIPTLVLETAYSQTPGQVHNVAKTWLHRLIRDEIETLADNPVPCDSLENLRKSHNNGSQHSENHDRGKWE